MIGFGATRKALDAGQVDELVITAVARNHRCRSDAEQRSAVEGGTRRR